MFPWVFVFRGISLQGVTFSFWVGPIGDTPKTCLNPGSRLFSGCPAMVVGFVAWGFAPRPRSVPIAELPPSNKSVASV